MLKDEARHDYAVIDVRRNDHGVHWFLFFFRFVVGSLCIQGGHVRGSSQVPAQTFHDDLVQFFDKYGQTKHVIFYCTRSRGRGPRCAGWYEITNFSGV